MVRVFTRVLRGSTALGLTLLVVALVACEKQAPPGQGMGTGQLPPTGSDLVLAAAMVALPPPGTAPSDLPEPESEGAHALQKYCSMCHALPSPATHSTTDWPAVLRRMLLRSEGIAPTYQVPVPDARERVVLLNYLLNHALKVSRSNLPPGVGRDLFATECARCHEMPDPRQHSPNDWAAVVIRMQQHMVQMLKQSPPQAQIQEVILYLEQASKAGL